MSGALMMYIGAGLVGTSLLLALIFAITFSVGRSRMKKRIFEE